jgi:hypothetical protein
VYDGLYNYGMLIPYRVLGVEDAISYLP